MSSHAARPRQLTRKDFVTDQDVRWCPGCGDYAILAQVQKVMPELGIPRENIVFISGIGCSSRFPYYMNTYGFHTIHGRAPGDRHRPEGDAPGAVGVGGDRRRRRLSASAATICIHVLRRNVDVNILLFNNRIYGLTKGQYSPTSELGKVTKSTPLGSIDYPLNPISVALGAEAHLRRAHRSTSTPSTCRTSIRRASQHRGTSFVEILQNCNIFNDGACRRSPRRTPRPTARWCSSTASR